MKFLLTVFASICLSISVSGQKLDSLIEAEAGVDLMSSYVWRGIRYVPSPAVQPSLSVSAGNFTLGTWSSWHFFSGWSEFDLYASYENDFLMLGVTDYYTASNFLLDNYFTYHSGASGHIVEINAGFPGSDKIPFRLLIATNLLGDLDYADHEQYSTFIELSWLFKLGKYESEIRAGFTPAEGIYANAPSPVEAAFKLERRIMFPQDFGLKMISELTVNPVTKGVYLVAGLGLIF